VDHADQSVITQTYAHFGTVVVNEYHTGLDIAPNPNTTLMAIAASTGEVIRIQQNGDSGCDAVPGGCSDHGYGNTVTLRHSVGNTTVYTQYSHLASISQNIQTLCGVISSQKRTTCSVPVAVNSGTSLGIVGGSGFG